MFKQGWSWLTTTCSTCSRIRLGLGVALTIFLFVGVLLAGGAAGLAWTNTEAFCIGCHEMQDNVYKEFKGTIHDKNRMEIDHSTGYMMSLRNVNTSLGFGVNGKPTSKLNMGANLALINDRNVYSQGLDSAASATNVAFLASSGGLPDVLFRQVRLTMFGEYALEKSAAVRLTVLHQQARLNEWTWTNNGVPFVYSDGTTISLNQNQKVTYAGAQYIYKFQ